MKKLLLVFSFVLLISGSAAADQMVTSTNINTVNLPPNVIVTPLDGPADCTSYAVRIKDGATWRSMAVVGIEKYDPHVTGEQDKQKTLQIAWEEFASKELKQTSYTISVEPAKKLTLDGKDCINASFKSMKLFGPAVVAHMEAFMVSEPDGVKLFMFMCADGDLPYWQPVMLKIVGAAP